MRLMTWNISHGGSSRIAAICGEIAEHQPDMLVLTEFQTYNEIPLRAHLTGLGYDFVATSEPRSKQNGLLVAAKLPFEAVPSADVAIDGERWLAVRVADIELDVLAVHIPGSDDDRFRDGFGISGLRRKELMWERVIDYARGHRDGPTIIVGDLNTGLREDAEGTPFKLSRYITTLGEIGFADSWRLLNPDTHDFTWFSKRRDKVTGVTQDLNGFRLDYVFVSAVLRQSIAGAQIIHGPRRAGTSDHAIVIADIDVGAAALKSVLSETSHHVAPPDENNPVQVDAGRSELADQPKQADGRGGAVSGSLDVFQRADVTIEARNSKTGLLMSAEITTPAGVINLSSADKNRWEVVASWLRGAPEGRPADVVYTAAQKQQVRAWAGDQGLGGGHLYRAGLKMLAEQQGWSITSARLPGA